MGAHRLVFARLVLAFQEGPCARQLRLVVAWFVLLDPPRPAVPSTAWEMFREELHFVETRVHGRNDFLVADRALSYGFLVGDAIVI